jgi:hypothetical protein
MVNSSVCVGLPDGSEQRGNQVVGWRGIRRLAMRRTHELGDSQGSVRRWHGRADRGTKTLHRGLA